MSIITKEFYNLIKIISNILKDWMQLDLRMDICGHAMSATNTYTFFSHTNEQFVL
jgi:hypothetical protein